MPGILSGQKRPIVDVSDEEEESDVSFTSSASKRARHGRDASDSPAPTRTHHRTQNGHRDEDEYAAEAHQPGSLVRVRLVNFVTYTAAEFNLGPSLNMVIGPNGTGKSTLVCAICLGLGWSPQHLGRAKEIGEFVKHGQPEATIEIELAAATNQRSNPIIRRLIRKEGNKSAFFINNRPVPQKEVVALARSFSIQIDNLCQFLPQDRVVEFARLDPISLLRETQRAAAPEHMVEWHDQLKALRTEEKGLEVQQQNEDHHLKSLQAKQNATREDVERFQQRQDLIVKSRALEKCRPIIRTRILKDEVEQIKVNMRASRRELEQYQAEVEPIQRAQREMEEYRDQVDRIAKSRKQRFDAAKGNVDRLANRIDNEQQNLGSFGAEIETEKQSEKQRRIDVKRIEGDINRLKRSMENEIEYDQSFFESQKAEIRNQKSSADSRRAELVDTLTRIRGEVSRKNADLANKTRDRQQLDTQSGQRTKLLEKLSKDTFVGWKWLEENKASLSLKEEVYPPPILSCSVPDSRYAKAVESQLRPLGDLTAITCTNADDAKVISDKLLGRREQNGLGLHQITIRTSPRPRAFYRSPETQAELTRLGFDGWIIDYIQGPDPVLAMLCDSTKLHRAAFAPKAISNQQYAALKGTQITKWISGNEVCQITTRREYGQSSTNITQLKPAQYFTDQPVDTEEKQQLDNAIKEIRRDIERRGDLHKDYKREYDQVEKERADADERRAEVQAEQEAQRRAYADFQSIPRKIATKETELQGIQSLSAETHSRIKTFQAQSENASLKIAALTLEYATSLSQLRVLHESQLEAEIRLIEANSEVEGYATDNAGILQALEQRKSQIKEFESQKARKSAEFKTAYSAAQRIIRELTDINRDIVQEFSELPSEESLDNEITAVAARLELMAEGNPNAVKAFEKREQDIKTAQEKLESMAERLETARERIREIREHWEPELDQLVAQISDGFSHNFQQIGCAGQVGVYKDEDFEQWSIQIQVRFRENESLSILDSHRQSGGERAVSTIFYLMALQDLARSPFRVVDEINQGMDPRNERMVHERMVDIACRERTSQYFLITPKLLNDLKFHPKMKVHCIASGEHMPDQRTNLDFQRLAKVALRLKKQRMAAA